MGTPIRTILKGCGETIKGTLLNFPSQLMNFFSYLLLLAVVGAGLILIQQTFFWMIPYMLRHCRFFTDLFNDIGTAISVAVNDFMEPGWKIISSAINGISAGAIHLPTVNPVNIGKISDQELHAFLSEVLEQCNTPEYKNVIDISTNFFIYYTGNINCASVRYLYPVPWLYKLSNWFLGWTFSGSAEPYAGYVEGDLNCNEFVKETGHDEICIWLASGWIIEEALIPILLVFVYFVCVAAGLWLILIGIFSLWEDII